MSDLIEVYTRLKMKTDCLITLTYFSSYGYETTKKYKLIDIVGFSYILVQNEEEMQEAMEKLYYSFEERKRRGEAAYRWLCTKGCRIEDKVDWLEKELLALRERRKEVGEN